MKRTLTVAEFVRLHEQRMAAFVANDCEQSDEWDAKNTWYLSDALNAAYAAIEETADNRPEFVLEWDDEGCSHFFMTQAAIDRINLTDTHPLPDFKRMSQYAVRLLNNACDTETQAEFDALALVPIESDRQAYRDAFFLNR